MLPVEPKVKGCHGPANGDEELTLNLTLPVRGRHAVWMGALSTSAPKTEALCCSFASLSVVLPLFLFLSPPLTLSLTLQPCHLYVI